MNELDDDDDDDDDSDRIDSGDYMMIVMMRMLR